MDKHLSCSLPRYPFAFCNHNLEGYFYIDFFTWASSSLQHHSDQIVSDRIKSLELEMIWQSSTYTRILRHCLVQAGLYCWHLWHWAWHFSRLGRRVRFDNTSSYSSFCDRNDRNDYRVVPNPIDIASITLAGCYQVPDRLGHDVSTLLLSVPNVCSALQFLRPQFLGHGGALRVQHQIRSACAQYNSCRSTTPLAQLPPLASLTMALYFVISIVPAFCRSCKEQ